MSSVGVDGSPHGPKCFVLWNPPLTMPALAAGAKGNQSHTEGRVRNRMSKCAFQTEPGLLQLAWLMSSLLPT